MGKRKKVRQPPCGSERRVKPRRERRPLASRMAFATAAGEARLRQAQRAPGPAPAGEGDRVGGVALGGVTFARVAS